MPDCQNSLSSTNLMEPDDLCRLKRSFCTGPTDDLDEASQQRLMRLLSGRQWKDTLDTVFHFIRTGRAAKRKPLIAALAFSTCHSTGDSKVDTRIRQAVYGSLPDVFHTPSDLFQLFQYESQFSKPRQRISVGRCKRSAIGKWYNDKTPMNLAYLVTKYKRRCGWSHRDVLRVAHVKASSPGRALVLKYVSKGFEGAKAYMNEIGDTPSDEIKKIFEYLTAVEDVKKSTDEQQVARLVEQHRLVHEHVPTWLMNSKEVWRALLHDMPMLALIKNLNRLGGLGLLDSASEDSCVQLVVERLTNEQRLRDARIHPVNIFLAMKTYEKGEPEKLDRSQWKPNKAVLDALETAFYKAFDTIDSSDKRYLLAIDASQSMQIGGVLGCSHIQPLVASAAMALILARREQSPKIVALSTDIQPLNVSPVSLLADVCTQLAQLPGSGYVADCAKPMLWAAEMKIEVDVFVVYTNQRGGGTEVGSSPIAALQRYRESMNCPSARLVIVTLTSSETISADSSDSSVIHLAGFDSETPEIIRLFAMGELDSAPPG